MRLPIALITLLTAGAVMAQTAAPKHEAAIRDHARFNMVQRLTAGLNLTVEQQNQVKAILDQSREQRKALQPKLREEHSALREAVKSDSEAKIDQITKEYAQVNAEAAAMHQKTMAKIYAVLTPEQKAKFDQRFEQGAWRNRVHAKGSSNRG